MDRTHGTVLSRIDARAGIQPVGTRLCRAVDFDDQLIANRVDDVVHFAERLLQRRDAVDGHERVAGCKAAQCCLASTAHLE